MKKILIAAVCAAGLSASSAATLSDLVGAERAPLLLAGESIKDMRVKDASLSLVPSFAGARDLVGEIASFDPDVVVEALFFHPKPAARSGRAWNADERLSVFNLLRSLSTLSGIEYFSASRGKMRVFYERSSVVDGPESDRELPDPVVSAIPARSFLYAVQKDLTFGENRYRYDYAADEASILFIQTNLTTMSYGVVPLLGKERLRTVVLVADTEDGLLLYAVSAARTALLPGLEGKMKNSFSNRADAVFRWFSTRMAASF